MLSLLLVVVCMGGVLAATSRDSDLYMDSVLSRYVVPQVRSSYLDPVRLSDISTTAQTGQDWLYGAYTAGNLYGLSSIRRSSCTAPYYNYYGNPALNCTLVFPQLQIRYDGRVNHGRSPTAYVKGGVDLSSTSFMVQVSTQRIRNLPALDNINFITLGNTRPSITGLGPLSSFLQLLIIDFQNYSIGQLMSVLNYQFYDVLRSNVSKLTMPLP